MNLKDKTLSSQAFLDSLNTLNEEESKFVQEDVARFSEELQELIFSLASQARTPEGSENLIATLNELLSARSEDG